MATTKSKVTAGKKAGAKSGSPLTGEFVLTSVIGLITYVIMDKAGVFSRSNLQVGEDTYAFVKAQEGAQIFKEVDPAWVDLYGNGRKPFLKLDKGTYVGKLTGITFKRMAQVATDIDGQYYKYWVDGDKVDIVHASNLDQYAFSEKLQSDLRRIVQAGLSGISKLVS